jgi:hypothetical protein
MVKKMFTVAKNAHVCSVFEHTEGRALLFTLSK